ncbi:MAG: hypothetical protein HXY53_09680 [Nitrospirae bacterium]|nr:hypothetical protein [Nitrospirota bacterium]
MNQFIKSIILILIILCFGCTTVVIKEKPPESKGKVAVCHKGKTIYVDEAAVKAHLGHGDYLGECR